MQYSSSLKNSIMYLHRWLCRLRCWY